MIDLIIQRVVRKFQSRSDVGIKKYGKTLDGNHAPMRDWVIHLQEGLMDAVNYAEKLLSIMDDSKTHDVNKSLLARIAMLEQCVDDLELVIQEKNKIIEAFAGFAKPVSRIPLKKSNQDKA
jgi:hypothetical protein